MRRGTPPNQTGLEIDVRRALGPDDYLARDGVMNRKTPLNIVRVRKFARRARMYRDACGQYRNKQEILSACAKDETTFGLIEGILKIRKRHRCTMDDDFSFVTRN